MNEKNYSKLELEDNEVTITLNQILTDPANQILSVKKANDSDVFIEGGLVIDYMISNGKIFRLIMSYTELGEWIEYHGELKQEVL